MMTTDACMTTGFLGCFHYAYFILQALRKRKQAIYQTDDDDD